MKIVMLHFATDPNVRIMGQVTEDDAETVMDWFAPAPLHDSTPPDDRVPAPDDEDDDDEEAATAAAPRFRLFGIAQLMPAMAEIPANVVAVDGGGGTMTVPKWIPVPTLEPFMDYLIDAFAGACVLDPDDVKEQAAPLIKAYLDVYPRIKERRRERVAIVT